MDDGRLRALLTAVECGSFSKAAIELGYTQSAMTHLVNNLESELGCRLLLRGSQGVRFSDEGEMLLPYITAVLDACDSLKSAAGEFGEISSRRLNIGCFPSIARSELPALIHSFSNECPDIKTDITVSGGELLRMLEKGEVNIALVDEGSAEGFDWMPIKTVPLAAVVPPDFCWQGDSIPIERLFDEPFISCDGQYVEKLLPKKIRRMQVTASDDAAIISMVAGGLGVSVLSSLSLRGYEGPVRVLKLSRPVFVTVGAAVKRGAAQSSSLRRFIGFLKNFYAEG